MSGKVIIERNDSSEVSIMSTLHGQDLYEAYVALTAKLAAELKNREDVVQICYQAAKDALDMLNNKTESNSLLS
jgi:hypothetical protein